MSKETEIVLLALYVIIGAILVYNAIQSEESYIRAFIVAMKQ